MTPPPHWDEVERERADLGSLCSYRTDLGRAAGSVTVGVNRIEIDPGRRSTPLHVEGAGEEIFVVQGRLCSGYRAS